ncbi:lipase family alpha/beta hydrolase [Vibrio hepatarius]|uniref:lipase family alpha/beta hydrolase n=1 Tax=Vibrio hepatarius TaxID=171383 RepID=UPI003736F5D2
MEMMFKLSLVTLLSLQLIGCGNLLSLRSDLQAVDSIYKEITVNVPTTDSTKRHIIVQLSELNKSSVLTVNSMEKTDKTAFPSFFNLTDYIFVFEDQNFDFTYQLSEPSYLFKQETLVNNRVFIQSDNKKIGGVPTLDGLAVVPYLEFKVREDRVGAVVTLDDPVFSARAKEMGMWQPLQFVENDYGGIFFLEAYDPAKIPVLFIHGMGGSGQDFEEMIAFLDKDKYQPWLVNYPSSLSLTFLAHSVASLMRQLNEQYQYRPIHIVAHSMGGVLTQRYLNVCSVGNRCHSIRSFTSIASPFGGVPSAESGVKYSPVAMPSWTGLMPNGHAIQNLFPSDRKNLRPPHLLIFGYDKGTGDIGASSDGTILMSSQLRVEAQEQAEEIYGFNYNHTDILKQPDVYTKIRAFWLRVESEQKE